MFPSNYDAVKSEVSHLIYHADTDKVGPFIPVGLEINEYVTFDPGTKGKM